MNWIPIDVLSNPYPVIVTISLSVQQLDKLQQKSWFQSVIFYNENTVYCSTISRAAVFSVSVLISMKTVHVLTVFECLQRSLIFNVVSRPIYFDALI